MKTYLECIPCFFKQALEAARLSGAGGIAQKRILDEVALRIPNFPLTSSPPEMGRIIYATVRKITGKDDPYAGIKEKSNRLALKIYGKLKKKVARSRDRLLTALELAIAGNIIDYGVKNSLNVERELDKILDQENEIIRRKGRSIFDYSYFKRALKKAKNILYLADNAGEVVFDRILIEEIKEADKSKHITYAVKEKPVINDALRKDALVAGIGKEAEIISNGLDMPGTVLSLCSKEFLKIFRCADMIISKGQGNFESLAREKGPLFFLFMAKCPVVAGETRSNIGDIILLCNFKKKGVYGAFRNKKISG